MARKLALKTRKRLYTALVVLTGSLLAALLLFGKPKPQPVVPPVIPAPQVEVLELTPMTRQVTVTTQGTVQPRREIDLVAQVAGKVVMVPDNFAAGGFFAEGDRLLQIEDDDYRFALVRAKARVADAEQLLATEQGRARQARREWRELGSEEANALFLREPQLASARAALAAAEAELAQAELDLARTAILSPFDGRIRETFVDLGQYVSSGTQVARIYSTDRVEVRLPLTDRQVALLDLPLDYYQQGRDLEPVPVTLTGEFAGQRWQWQGQISRTDASIDIESRVLYAVAEVLDPFRRDPDTGRPPLSIGQYVEAEIDGRALNGILSVPRSALRSQNTIWTVDAENRLRVQPVNIIQSRDQEVLVRMPDDEPLRLVVSSLSLAIDGMAVTATVRRSGVDQEVSAP